MPSDGWFRAAGSSVASHQVGGDYFDVRRVNPHCWSIVVADVSGKGVSSALLASFLQGALLSVTDRAEEMAARLARLSAYLNERTGGEKYATIFHALLDESGKLTYANAAHCPALVVRASGEREWLDATGMPAGIMEGAEYETAILTLGPGDKIVLYTDGVTEAQNSAGEFFGRKRMIHAVTEPGGSCAEIHESLQVAVAAFTEGTPQSDDITALVLEYQP
jgi:sigma-B regulation protein RsbU (phosphoserine phosphatase)